MLSMTLVSLPGLTDVYFHFYKYKGLELSIIEMNDSWCEPRSSP